MRIYCSYNKKYHKGGHCKKFLSRPSSKSTTIYRLNYTYLFVFCNYTTSEYLYTIMRVELTPKYVLFTISSVY